MSALGSAALVARGSDVLLPVAPRRPSAPRGGEPLQRLFDAPLPSSPVRRGGLTPELAAGYDGELAIPLRADRPTVVANFVETLDGVVAFDRAGRTGGGDVSGSSLTDRFVMGLLRSLADVILVGASTVRTSPRGSWTPGSIAPTFGEAYAALRERLGLDPAPALLIATASGDLDPDHPVFAARAQAVVIAAGRAGAERLARRRFPPHVAIARLAGAGEGSLTALIDAAACQGAGLVVSEAGPHLFGRLLAAGLVDELFLTVAPQLAGRADDTPRLGLVEGAALWPAGPGWADLVSARRAGDHLFLRYRFEESR